MVDVKQKTELKAEELQKLLKEENTKEFRTRFLDQHPYEQAMFYRDQKKESRLRIYTYLSPKEMSDIMEYIELEETEKKIRKWNQILPPRWLVKRRRTNRANT